MTDEPTCPKPVVLICLQHFLPAFKSGGPIKSIQALTEQFGDQFEFRVITFDRDSGDTGPFGDIEVGKWTALDHSQVNYISKTAGKWTAMLHTLRSTPADLLYLQSLSNPVFTLLPVLAFRLGFVKSKHCLVAPRGELSDGALSVRPFKKKIFLSICRLLGLFRKCCWHATSDIEAIEIKTHMKPQPTEIVSVAKNLVPITNSQDAAVGELSDDCLRVLFLSRIAPKKNLEFAIQALSGCSANIHFSICGPIDRDKEYWSNCQKLLDTLPVNLSFQYEGSIEPKRVAKVFQEHDLFLFPTKGENFGHVIAESLLNGCPVMVSDQTPWLDLQTEQAGWVFGLDQIDAFTHQLDQYASLTLAKRRVFRENARSYGIAKINSALEIKNNYEMLLTHCQA